MHERVLLFLTRFNLYNKPIVINLQADCNREYRNDQSFPIPEIYPSLFYPNPELQ